VVAGAFAPTADPHHAIRRLGTASRASALKPEKASGDVERGATRVPAARQAVPDEVVHTRRDFPYAGHKENLMAFGGWIRQPGPWEGRRLYSLQPPVGRSAGSPPSSGEFKERRVAF
jgi:hypothetical protein